METTRTGFTPARLRKLAMSHVERGLRLLRPNPVVTQLDALNDALERYYAGDRTPALKDRIAALLYVMLEAPMRGTRMPGVDSEDVRQEVIAKLWDWLLSGHLRTFLPIRGKGWFGTMFRNEAIDQLRKQREASMEGIREIASTGVSLTRMPLTEEEFQAAVLAATEMSPAEAARLGPARTYLRRWYGRRPDIVVARELEVTPDNLRVRAHRAGVSVYAGDAPRGKTEARKIPELRRDAAGELAVPVPMPRKPPNARREWFERWYPVLTELELEALTGYSSFAKVRAGARRLGIPDRPAETGPLNRVAMEWIALVYPVMSDGDMALDLGVPPALVRRALDRLDVTPATRAPRT